MSEPNRIFHVDGDSFFASCEIALDRKLEGRPVWVGGGRRGDGIVIAANRTAPATASPPTSKRRWRRRTAIHGNRPTR